MPMRPMSHAQRMRELLPKRKDDRPSAARRGYDAVWRRFRIMVLNRRPMCEHPGCDQAAEELDHRIPLERGGERLDEANVQPLCKTHHSQKTAKHDGGFGRAK